MSVLQTDDIPGASPYQGLGHRTRSFRNGIGRPLSASATQIFLIIWAIMVIFPLAWMVMTAFKSDREIFYSPWQLPAELQWGNFARAWAEASIGQYFINSVIVVAGSLTLTLLLSSMLAYAIARFEFPGNRLLYYTFLIGLMFPVFLALVPLFFVVNDLHMLSTYRGLILVYTAYSLPFTIFFLIGFFRSLPTEVAEAAIVDGASHYRVFFSIMLPMARSGLVAVGIFNFLGHWNQFILPLVLNTDQDRYVLSQGLAFLAIQQGYASDWSALFAGLTITMIPTLIVYAIFQRKVQQGLTVGALKG